MSEKDWEVKTKTSASRHDWALRFARHPATLTILDGPGAGRVFRLEQEETLIGRQEGADIRLDSSEVSRRHVVIRRTRAGYRLQDQKSHNGTYLNGVKIHSAILHSGDKLTLGDVVLEFRDAG